MGYRRNDINGTTPLDLKNLNDNFRNLWYKVFGDIDITDTSTNFQNIINGKTIYIDSSMGMNAGLYTYSLNDLPETVWDRIKNGKCNPSINITGVQPITGYDFVKSFNVFINVDKTLPSVSIEVIGVSGKYVNGTLQTSNNLYINFDVNFLI